MKFFTMSLALISMTCASVGQFSVVDDFKRAKDQFEKQVTDLETDQAGKVKAARDRYLAALTTAEKKAEESRKEDALRAIAAEKEVAATGLQMAVKGPPALPPELSSPRTNFVREMDRIIKTGASEAKAISLSYLKTLASLEARVRVGRDQAIIQEIVAEKGQAERIAHPAGGSPSIPFSRRKNVVVNGSFSETTESGAPVGWQGSGGKVTAEGGETFLRVTERSYSQKVLVPP